MIIVNLHMFHHRTDVTCSLCWWMTYPSIYYYGKHGNNILTKYLLVALRLKNNLERNNYRDINMTSSKIIRWFLSTFSCSVVIWGTRISASRENSASFAYLSECDYVCSRVYFLGRQHWFLSETIFSYSTTDRLIFTIVILYHIFLVALYTCLALYIITVALQFCII